MNYYDLYKLDRQCGGFLCQGKKAIRKLKGRITRLLTKNKPVKCLPEQPPARILIVKLWGIGNLVLAGRSLKSIRLAYHNAHITLVTTRECSYIYKGAGLYDSEVIFSCHREENINSAVAKLCLSLNERMFDLAINFDGLSNISASIAAKCGAKCTVGMGKQQAHDSIYTVESPYLENSHVEDLIYDCAIVAGGSEISPGLITPVISSQDNVFCAELLSNCEVKEHTLLIGININAGGFSEERRWPLEKFAILAQMIESHEEFRTVFFGGEADERYVSRAISLMDTPGINLAGMLDLGQMIAFLKRIHLLITNDSGLLHLAAALSVPTVSIFGPESPARAGRRDAEEHAVVYHPTICSPCVSMLGMSKQTCLEGGRCVRDISVEDVWTMVTDMLDYLADPVDPPWL